MQLGMVGLGRMGANMATRLLDAGHELVVHDVMPDAAARWWSSGATAAESLEALAERLRAAAGGWIMVPAGDATEATLQALAARC
jgi:6-phosphogluconate dehydrogenase